MFPVELIDHALVRVENKAVATISDESEFAGQVKKMLAEQAVLSHQLVNEGSGGKTTATASA